MLEVTLNLSLIGILVMVGIVYFLVAKSEYEDFKELSDMGIKGETAEKQFEVTFFVSSGLVNFILAVLVLRSHRTNAILDFGWNLRGVNCYLYSL